jgi:hypothetical protein
MTEEASLGWVGWITIVLYLAIGVFPYLSSGLLAPLYGVIVLMVCWGIGLVITWRLARTRPVLSLLAVPVALAFWWAVLTAGDVFLGWTA